MIFLCWKKNAAYVFWTKTNGMSAGQTRHPLPLVHPNLWRDYALANFLMALQVTGLASQISEIFRRNAGTVTSPRAQI